jgi:ion channel-forming bestrophin family protein
MPTLVAAYIILSFVAIGRELENPFGDDVNDLPLDSYCKQVATEIDIITATPAPKMVNIMTSEDNFVLYPLSLDGFDKWMDRSMEDIRGALKAKVTAQKKFADFADADGSITTTTTTNSVNSISETVKH